jgi:hypothetical protein
LGAACVRDRPRPAAELINVRDQALDMVCPASVFRVLGRNHRGLGMDLLLGRLRRVWVR